jgi:F0F1-type ATP synthase membrane subunit a
MNFLLAATDPMEEVLPHVLFRLPFGSFAFTNQMLMTVLAAVLMLLIFPALFSYANGSAPSGSRNFFESILEFLRVEVFRPALKQHADRFVPFLWTLFFFILFSNLLGQVPVNELVTVLTGKECRIWGTATGTPITTGALAICAFVLIHVSGVMEIARSLLNGTYGHHDHHEHHEHAEDLQHMRGDALPTDAPSDLRALTDPAAHYDDGKDNRPASAALVEEHPPKINPVLAVLMAIPLYFWNFAPHPFKPGKDASGIGRLGLWIADIFMWSILLVLELLGALIKPFSLTIRLFANMIGGHIVLGALILLIPVTAGLLQQVGFGIPITFLSLVIRCLELFVAFLQAYIFTFLVTLFIASAVAPEH